LIPAELGSRSIVRSLFSLLYLKLSLELQNSNNDVGHKKNQVDGALIRGQRAKNATTTLKYQVTSVLVAQLVEPSL
jgi:hypothetical protein